MNQLKIIPIGNIIITTDNPRQEFKEESLERLGESIKTHGLLQPIIVRRKNGHFELVVGERRLRAAQRIGLTEIEAKIEDIDDATCMELRLIENTHREDLTHAEKGDAVYSLIENYPEKYERVADVARAINTPNSTVRGWCMASDKLSPKVKRLIQADRLDDSKARYLFKYDHLTQDKIAETIVDHGLTWRQIADFIKHYDANPTANLDDLADEVVGIKRVEIPDLDKLTSEARREVEEIIEEKKELVEKVRRKAMVKARKVPRKKFRKARLRVEPEAIAAPSVPPSMPAGVEVPSLEVKKIPERPETKGVVLTALVPTELYTKLANLAGERRDPTLSDTVVYILKSFFER